MEKPDIPQLSNQASEQPRKKLWHGILFGLGCGTSTMAVSFICLFAIALFYAFTNSSEISSILGDMTNNEIRQNTIGAFALIVGGSLAIALIAGFLGGIAVYRHSSDANATRRLFISISIGFGFGSLLFIIGFLSGVVFEDYIFTPLGMSFGEGTFSFYVLFPIIPGALLAFFGGLLGTILVFRRLLPKSKTVVS